MLINLPCAFAWAVNNRGQVIGYRSTPTQRTSIFWSADHEIALPFGTIAINNSGQVLGKINLRSFLWQDGRLFSLGDFGLPYPAYSLRDPRSLNGRGDVVGTFTAGSDPRTGSRGVFVWSRGRVQTLPGLFHEAEASHINNSGTIVGSAERSSGQWVAALWVPRMAWSFPGYSNPRGYVVVDLNVRVPPGTPLLVGAFVINDQGEILCNRSVRGQVLLRPRWQPPPSYYRSLPPGSHAP